MTVEIDTELDSLLQEYVRKSGATYREAVRTLLQRGLDAAQQESQTRFVVLPAPLGLPRSSKVSELLNVLEGEERR